MYKDYYTILEVHYSASLLEIKKQYRLLAKKWHPDVNKAEEATAKMQEIIEAYLILNDNEARERYDKIHEFYFRQNKDESKEKQFRQATRPTEKSGQFNDDIPKTKRQEPHVQTDPILDDWILKAKQQAKDFVLQSIQDVKGITVSGCKYTAYAIGITIIIFISILIVIFIWRALQ
jgi:DnaJ-class molecular chaperone